ncbi:putative aminopeptidase [Belliella baltica DSM 15883]|uniref:Putative aminopeptidase n=1 Tax=Belliella baltica (strain DSM 15883 / CIP 108006 / LMG 21964 / BA134) TaxID=866536 RepID=I3Z169_BELBD|nr:M28 family peptidase [Belliella baltica]AFL82987.1 putative aminopeptidase [Belliella baltica DSM 15883]
MKNSIILGFLLLVSFWACDSKKSFDQVVEQITYKEVPEFNADSAYQFIQKQVDFGPRVPMTIGHQQTKEWIIAKFQEFGLEVQTQEFQAKTYDNQTWDLTNIIASYNPSAQKRIMISAHWDTRRIADKDTQRIDEPIDGANDGGSGVGVALELARIITSSNLKPDVGIDFILFDGEDDGEPEQTNLRNNSQTWWCLGSQHWSKNPHENGYKAFYGILLDMVGGKGARFYREGYSMYFAKNIVNKVWNYGIELGYSDLFILKDTGEITDDHFFVNKDAGIPMIDIIEFSPEIGFGRYHHTHDDNMDLIDKRTLKAVGQTVLFTLYQE